MRLSFGLGACSHCKIRSMVLPSNRIKQFKEASLKRIVAGYQIERNHSEHATLETKVSVTLLSFLLAFLKQDKAGCAKWSKGVCLPRVAIHARAPSGSAQ